MYIRILSTQYEMPAVRRGRYPTLYIKRMFSNVPTANQFLLAHPGHARSLPVHFLHK